MAARFWTCQRQANGTKCGAKNSARRQLCAVCGVRRPAKRKPAHMAVLSEMPYEDWMAMFGSNCGICGAAQSEKRRLDRDHDHKTGEPRGLLCHLCNRTLGNRVTIDWLEKALAYLRRAENTRRAA